MTTLDTLARSSAQAVHFSVASVPVPVRGIVSTTRWFYFRRSLGYALAGSAAAIVAVVALMVVSTPADEVTDVTETTAVSVAPTTTVAPNTVPPSTPPTTLPGNAVWITMRMSGLSMPMPKAIVATMTSIREARNSACTSSRAEVFIPA